MEFERELSLESYLFDGYNEPLEGYQRMRYPQSHTRSGKRVVILSLDWSSHYRVSWLDLERHWFREKWKMSQCSLLGRKCSTRNTRIGYHHHHHHHHIQPLLVHCRTKAIPNILHLSLSDVSELQLGPANALISSLHLTLCLPDFSYHSWVATLLLS